MAINFQIILFAILLFIDTGTIAFGQKYNLKGEIMRAVTEDYGRLDKLYKYLHSNPELSFMEKNTSARLAGEMKSQGFDVTEKFGGYGIVCILKNGDGPVVLVRTDMDGLPVREATNADFASKAEVIDSGGNKVGVMHACGHDVHMSVWAGTAKVLSRLKERWKGTIIFIGQPAEERGSGALIMLNEGLFTKFPRPDYALALHVNSSIEAGKVGYCPEYALANVDMMDMTVHGVGGHGAYPQTTIDPIVLSSRIIMGLQTIVSREISPIEPAVITVGSIHGGTKHNIIPTEVKLELTLRSYSDEVRNAMIEKIRRMCRGIAISAGLPENKYPEIRLRDEFTPALYNDPELARRISEVFTSMLGDENVIKTKPVMGGEDFSEYGRQKPHTPIFMYWLGAIPKEKIIKSEKEKTPLPSLHSADFLPDAENTIKTGVLTMSTAVMELLKK